LAELVLFSPCNRFKKSLYIFYYTGNFIVTVCLLSNIFLKVNADSCTVNALAGTGSNGVTGDGGKATSATFQALSKMWLSTVVSDDVYINDLNRVRKMNLNSEIISFFAGGTTTPTTAGEGDGKDASDASVGFASYAVCGDTAGNIYLADYQFSRLRKIAAADHIISTVAGEHIISVMYYMFLI
jgi:hypothetical protein